jgi:pilus assembly protein Flp/PilA
MARYLLYNDYLGLSWENQFERTQMNTMFLKMYVKFQDLISRDEGQDLVEYALVVAIIALGCVVAMGSLATGISTAFGTITTNLAGDV